jgi:hypothetical protein
VYVVDLVWREAGQVRDESDADHVLRHGVTEDELEEAFFAASRWLRLPGKLGRRVSVGRTRAGRALALGVEPWSGPRGADEGLWSPVTARDATAAEKRRYLGR